jgi:hypothetical protein
MQTEAHIKKYINAGFQACRIYYKMFIVIINARGLVYFSDSYLFKDLEIFFSQSLLCLENSSKKLKYTMKKRKSGKYFFPYNYIISIKMTSLPPQWSCEL